MEAGPAGPGGGAGGAAAPAGVAAGGGWAGRTAGTVLCCMCGVPMPPNPSNMCAACLRARVDVTEGLQRQVNVLWCKGCGRYHQPPKAWIVADLESKELLTYCLKRLRGLSKVKLVDAGFIWTEPHSRRLKVKLTVQKEVHAGTILQQTFVVEYVVETLMCEICNRVAANMDQWQAVVQVRQRVEHKRTFLYLEQLLLKHGAHDQAIGIKEFGGGLDFYFGNRSHALKLIDFLQNVIPVRHRHDKQLVSHDTHSNTYNYKYTFMVEIVPVCKDDLLLLPQKTAVAYGNFGPVVLCLRVNQALQLIDVATCRSQYVDSNAYFREPFKGIMHSRRLTEFIVLDVEVDERTRSSTGQYVMADCEVARLSDFGANDTTYHTRTHLGNVLHPGDHVYGYDVAYENVVDRELEGWTTKGLQLPDVMLVRKSFNEHRRRKAEKGQRRQWKLRDMDIEQEDLGYTKGREKAAQRKKEQEREEFLRELEEDAEMRSRINLYRDRNVAAPAPREGAEESDEESLPDDVRLEELLDELTLQDAAGQAGGAASAHHQAWGAEEGAEDMDME